MLTQYQEQLALQTVVLFFTVSGCAIVRLLFLMPGSLPAETFSESFKVISLFSYQGSLLLLFCDSHDRLSQFQVFVNNFFIFISLFEK